MDDEIAIEKCRNGELEAFRHLVERYQKQAAGHATAILGSRDDALDATQEAFIDAFRALKNFARDHLLLFRPRNLYEGSRIGILNYSPLI